MIIAVVVAVTTNVSASILRVDPAVCGREHERERRAEPGGLRRGGDAGEHGTEHDQHQAEDRKQRARG